MKTIFPDFAPAFRCLAGSCPDTCCKDWQIILDDETLRLYRSLPGQTGKQIRQNLITENGETRFALTDGHCRLLTEDGLCAIQLQYGEDALCTTCASHPRFYEEYGERSELTLSISCPAAARLLLQHPEKITFQQEWDGEPDEELDQPDYPALLCFRSRAICLAQDRRFSIADRMTLILRLAERCQRLLDAERYAALEMLCGRFGQSEDLLHELRRLRRPRCRKGSFVPCLTLLQRMEHLTAEFPALLNRAAGSEYALPPVSESVPENLLVYFLFRYPLKAVNDAQLLARTQSCLFHVLAIRALHAAGEDGSFDALVKTAGLYSKEVEHSDDNLALVQGAFENGTISSRYLLSLLHE